MVASSVKSLFVNKALDHVGDEETDGATPSDPLSYLCSRNIQVSDIETKDSAPPWVTE